MEQLREVLLVQQVRAHGITDYPRIAAALQQHPLLTSLEEPTTNLTPDTCKLMYERVCERETAADRGVNQQEGASLIQEVWQALYPRYIAMLKQRLRDDEEQYETLRILTERPEEPKEDDVVEEPQATTNEAVEHVEQQVMKRPGKPGRKPLARKASIKGEEAAQGQAAPIQEAGVGDVDMQDAADHLSPVSVHEEAKGRNAVEEAKSSRGLEMDLTVKAPPDEAPQADQDSTPDAPAMDSPISSPEAVKEIVAARASSKSPSANQEVETAAPTPRITRTRSSTMNTVASDVVMREEQVTPQVPVKKRAGRPSKKQALRAESKATSPAESTSMADEHETPVVSKRFQSTIMPVLGSINSHRYASVFASPVSDRDAPNYSTVIHYPMDLKTLRMQIKSGEISNVESFQCAIFRMLSNAVVYNSEDSEIAVMARDLFDHVEVSLLAMLQRFTSSTDSCQEAVSLYKAADEYAEPAEDRTPKRRRRNDA